MLIGKKTNAIIRSRTRKLRIHTPEFYCNQPVLKLFKRKPQTIKIHQHSSAFINIHQHSSIFINIHQHWSTLKHPIMDSRLLSLEHGHGVPSSGHGDDVRNGVLGQLPHARAGGLRGLYWAFPSGVLGFPVLDVTLRWFSFFLAELRPEGSYIWIWKIAKTLHGSQFKLQIPHTGILLNFGICNFGVFFHSVPHIGLSGGIGVLRDPLPEHELIPAAHGARGATLVMPWDPSAFWDHWAKSIFWGQLHRLFIDIHSIYLVYIHT